MRRSSRLACCVGLALGLFAPAALAAPPVLDRVPKSAVAVITTSNVAGLHKNLSAFAESLGDVLPMPVPELGELLASAGIEEGKGFDPNSSVAITFLPPPPEGEAAADAEEEMPQPDQMVVFLFQTTGYAEFLQNFKATPGAAGAIDSGVSNEETYYFKDIGGGFVAMSPVKDAIELADWNAGNAPAHNESLGKTGRDLLDKSDLSMIVFTQQARQFMPDVEKAMEEQLAAVPGAEAVAGLKDSPIGSFITGPMMDDATASITGISLDAQGVTIDTAVAFREGSETAKTLSGLTGSSSQLLSKLPTQPYLLAMAADLSSPAARKLLDEVIAAGGEAENDPTLAFFKNWAKSSDGAAILFGMPPGGLLGGGLFNSTVAYVKTLDAAAFVKNIETGLKQLDGKSTQGMLLKTSYIPGGGDIDGAKVDTWAINVEVDPDSLEDPGQIAMGLQAMFGPSGGPSGYMAPANGGLIQTFGRNQTLMQSAMKVGRGAEAFSDDKVIVKVSEFLPKNRVAEVYLGMKTLLEAAIPIAAMAGNIDLEVEIPPSLPPIALGVAGGENAAHLGVYLPSQTLKTIIAIAMQAQAADAADLNGPGGGKKNDGRNGAGQPRF